MLEDIRLQYQVTKKRIKLTIALVLLALCVLGISLGTFMDREAEFLSSPEMGLVVLCLVIGCYAQSIELRMPSILNALWIGASFFVLPFLMVHVIEYLSGHDIVLLSVARFGLNFFWCQLVYAFLFAVTNHYRWSIVIASIVCYLIGGINHFVQLFRGSPFQISDILAVGTAADVVSNYVITINPDLLLSGSITFLAVSLATLAEFHRKRREWKSITASVVLFAYIAGAVNYFYSDALWRKYSLTIDYWNPLLSYTNNGTMLSFAMGANTMRSEKPQNYSAAMVKQVIQDMMEEDGANISELGMDVKMRNTSGSSTQYAVHQEETPHMIVIMNESYADLNVLGSFSTTLPVMEYYKSLQKNTVKGNLLVSTLGGGTCNTEFEFLTGLNMAFLPSGVMTYSQYLKKDIDSMADIMSAQGYTPIAFHPGQPGSWDRNVVYPYMGFEAFYTAEDMDDPVYMRDAYISDASNYEHVIKLFEEKEQGEKLFLFNVTIQNHGGYMLDTVGIPQWVAMRGEYRKYNQAEQYLSLMRASDKALKDFITYFEKVDEPTMIVFFGDHQPNVESAFIEDLMGEPLASLNMEEVQRRYTVPFFIWTNYDIEEAYYDKISVNYLSTLAMELAGLELPAYNQYLSRLYEKLPVVNALGYADGEGGWHYFREENELQPYLDGYEMVQYDYLFGGRQRSDALYRVDVVE